MKKLFTLILLSVFVFGCKNDGDAVVDEQTPRTIYSYTGSFAGISEMWIILHDSETGELIDSKPVKENVPLVFQSDKKISNDKLSVTHLLNYSGLLAAAVYNGVDVGSVWVEKNPFGGTTPKDRGNPFGSYSLRISNVPDAIGYTLSNGVDQIGSLLGQDNDILSSADVPLFSTSRDHLVSIYPKTGKPRYQFFNAIENGAAKETSYTNMKEYDKIVNLKFPAGTAPMGTITLRNNGYNYRIYENFGVAGQAVDLTEINLGFLNDFNDYSISLTLDNFDFQYESFGPAPTLIQYVDPDLFVINDKSIDKFSATASHEYNFRAIRYVYIDPDNKANVDITYYDPSPGARHNDPFTPELISKFSIPMNKVTFESASFVVAGQTYDQWKAYRFDASVTSTSYVKASVVKD